MRILHTSDWHLGLQIAGEAMEPLHEKMAEALFEACVQEKIDAVLIAGDVFDRAISPGSAVSLYSKVVSKLCMELNIKTVVIAGNHDSAARISSLKPLLSKAGLFVFGTIKEGIGYADIGDVRAHAIPYFSIDEGRYVFGDAQIESYEDAMRCAVSAAEKNIDRSKKNILVAHCYARGAELMESDRAAIIGGENAVSAALFSAFDYVALGHLHKPQNIGENARYSGSPIKLSFAEAGSKKTFTIIDTQDMEIRQREIVLPWDLREVKGTYEKILEDAQRDDKREDYLKITLEDEFANMFTIARIREEYPNLLILEGKSYEGSGEKVTSISAEDIAKSTDKQILMDFYEYETGELPTDSMVKWFERACEKAGMEDAL